MTRATREKISRAQELLGNTVAPEAIADVIDRALGQLIVALEKYQARAAPQAARRAGNGHASCAS